MYVIYELCVHWHFVIFVTDTLEKAKEFCDKHNLENLPTGMETYTHKYVEFYGGNI